MSNPISRRTPTEMAQARHSASTRKVRAANQRIRTANIALAAAETAHRLALADERYAAAHPLLNAEPETDGSEWDITCANCGRVIRPGDPLCCPMPISDESREALGLAEPETEVAE